MGHNNFINTYFVEQIILEMYKGVFRKFINTYFVKQIILEIYKGVSKNLPKI